MKQKKKMTLQERMKARIERIDEASGYGPVKKKVAKKKVSKKKVK